MRASHFLIATQKESPADAEIISHQLMLRTGMIRKLAAGLYTWLPLGLRCLRKVEQVVRQEMDAAGAQELLMPAIQPAELWQESGRWNDYGLELLRLQDRHLRDFCVGPTHEEVITALARREFSSYKQLPINFYQIQTKFRDEVRPRFGIMRAREFIMKDAYSFHIDQPSLQQTYIAMHQAYTNIFTRLGLEFRAVNADSGSIGGNTSQEFHVLASAGEDDIAFSDNSDYAANVELATTLAPNQHRTVPTQTLQKVHTPSHKTIDAVSQFLALPRSQCVKTILVLGVVDEHGQQPLVALLLRGDHHLNKLKAEKHPLVASPLTLAPEQRIRQEMDLEPGFIGPVGLKISILADFAVTTLADFTCGANSIDHHYIGTNWERDCSYTEAIDLRYVVNGDPSPCGQGQLVIKRGIEVGHIFQLGDKYARAMNANILNEHGQKQAMWMGCYGIGISRIVAAAIEQNHDAKGIVWPIAIAPFELILVPLNYDKSYPVKHYTDKLYDDLQAQGIDVLLDDRSVRAGVKFNDAELIGIPHRIVIGDHGIKAEVLEYHNRNTLASQDIPTAQVLDFIKKIFTKIV